MMFYTAVVSTLLLPYLVRAWPDGAPCVHAAYESMNPLEAVEHQGGLQLTPPPYEILVEQKCYWRNQPIGLTLQGHNESIWFKGFVIQPLEWNNGRLGTRIGQIIRLDANGSWQQQCFRFKDSATHSHDEKKKHMKMWWKVDGESTTVQFVATVVKHQTMFWVRSVYSRPIPPCRLNRNGIEDYIPPAPHVPPPVKAFKTETNREFGNDRITPRLPDFTTPMPTRRSFLQESTPRMNRIIPIADGFHSVVQTTPFVASTTTVATTVFQPRQEFRPQQRQQFQRRFFQTQQQQFIQRQQQTSVQQSTCQDTDPQNRCPLWGSFCVNPRFVRYLQMFCRRTCGFCR